MNYFQHIDALEQKVAGLESQKLEHSVDRWTQHEIQVSDEIDHLDERLRRAEADLAYMNDNQQSSELRNNRKVSSSFFTVLVHATTSMCPIHRFSIKSD